MRFRTSLLAGPKLGPSLVRGILSLPWAKRDVRRATGALLDAAGRCVMSLKPGANDVSRLPAGVYFVRGAGRGMGDEGRMRKVVLAE